MSGTCLLVWYIQLSNVELNAPGSRFTEFT